MFVWAGVPQSKNMKSAVNKLFVDVASSIENGILLSVATDGLESAFVR